MIQRVKSASVEVDSRRISQIEAGLLLLIGIENADNQADLDYATRKIVNMRIFPDENRRMNRSVKDIGGSLLAVSQFTLFADTKHGSRPSFTGAGEPKHAKKLYEAFCQQLQEEVPIETGVFGADMQVSLINDGPVTLMLDTKENQK